MTGRRVLITGASSGIGAAALAELVRRRAEVVGLDINAAGELIRADVRDQESVNAAVAEALERLGGLDVLINCAGLATPQSAGLPPDARAEAVIDVNLMGTWRVTGAAMPALRESGGRVVNVASGMAFVALPFAPAYAMSKHGIVAYGQSLRLEHGDEISVTTVYPGIIKTPIHRDSEEFGLTLEGTSPTESIEDAVTALMKATFAEPAPRDITTTRSGRFLNALSQHAPKRLVDRVVLSGIRKSLKDRNPVGAAPPLADFVARLQASTHKQEE